MEILQTIWSALTSENNFGITIISMPLCYIEIFLTLLLSSSLLNLNFSRKKMIIFTVIFGTISNISFFILSDTIRIIINLILFPILIMIILKQNFFKGLLIEFLPVIFMVISEIIWSKILNLTFNISSTEFTLVPLFKLIMSILNYITIFIIYIFSKKFKINISIFEGISRKTNFTLTLNFIIGLIAVISQIYLVTFYSTILPFFIIVIGLLSLFAYFFISMYSLVNTSKLAIATTNLEQEKETNRSLKEMEDELQAFRHDFSNILCTISGYIQVNDMNGLKQYYSEIQKDINKVNTLSSLNPEIINNPAIFILISSKYSKALEENIEMNINVFLDLNTLNMKIYEFTRILGIILDNAIEAAKECNEKNINIEIRKDSNKNRQLLIIENTYNEKDIDTEKIFEKKYSTKQGNSGLGLWEVRQIIKRNKNLNLFTSKNDKYFTQQLEIY